MTRCDVIDKPYVLFTRIPLLKTQFDRLYCDPLWAKDLKLHLAYLSDFRICCPVVHADEVQGLEEITGYGIQRVFALRKDYGLVSVVKNLLPNFAGVIRACKDASIVHSGGAGWAFPLSFYLLLLRPFFSFRWVIVIESSFWMLNQGDRPTLRKLIEHHVHKALLSLCVKQADARIFTQSFYRKYFLKDETARTLIAPATWLDKDNFVDAATIRTRYLERHGKTLQLIFPARLVEDKGVAVLFGP